MQIPQTMVYYHVHSMLSNGTTNVDSITNFRDYVKAAKECGMPALGFSEHGNIFEWLHKKEAIEAAGMKYIHGIEAYLTEDGEDCAFYTATDLINTEMANAASGKSSIKMQFKFRKHWQSEDGKWLAIAEEHPMSEMVGKTLWYDPDDVQKSYDKIKDNYHCVLIAKNYEGVKELNRLVSRSFCRDDFHFYYMPRISFDELFATSDNIIVTTACLGGVLHKGSPVIRERFMGFLRMNKHRCFLEIQHHNCADQIEYNRFLYELSQSIDVPLIAGTDTHAMNATHMEGRAVLQRAKGVHFGGEDEWDLTFKTVGELIAAYKRQKSLPMDVVYQAINNTVVMADMVEPFKLDYSPKYPKLYADSEGEFKRKINAGVIWRGVNKLPNYKTYLDRIHYEYDTYKHNNAIDFMLLEEDYKSEMRRRGVKFGYSRGSVSGSEIAYLLGITEIDSVKYDLNFERFMNKERVSLADIDTDWLSEDREIVKQYLYGKKGLYCCDIVTFNTIALKGSIRDVCRGFFNENMDNLSDEVKAKIKAHRENIKGHDSRDMDVSYSKELQAEITADYLRNAVHREVPYDYIAFGNQLANMIDDDEAGARKKYPAIFRLVDMVNGCVVSVGNHPAGCVVSPVPVDEWFGTFTSATDDYPISVLNMKEIDSLNFVKLDILGLDNIGLIYKTCELAGIPFLTPDNTPADDKAVWDSIKDDTTMIFQWESKSATAYLKQLFSDTTVARIREKNPNFSYMNLLSVGNGAIRPAGESYRDNLAQGIYQDNGHAALNDFLAPTLGYLVYQEEVIEFLHSFCGYTMGQADIVRRCIDEDSLILMANGETKKVKDVKPGDRVLSVNSDGVVKPDTVNKVYNNGKQETYKITAKHNYELIATKGHKVLTQRGWQKVEDLTHDDFIMTPREIICDKDDLIPSKRLDMNDMFLIGIMIGDGTLGNDSMAFTNADEELIEAFKRCILNRASGDKSKVKFSVYAQDGVTVDKVYTITVSSHPHKDSLKNLFSRFGLDVKSAGKHIPSNLMLYPPSEKIQSLLGGLFSTDAGCVKQSHSLEYYTTSYNLANDIKHLLLKFGIYSYVYSSYVTGYDYNCYKVRISQRDSLKLFGRYVLPYVIGKNRKDISEIIDYYESDDKCYNFFLPRECKDEIWDMSVRTNVSLNSLLQSEEWSGKSCVGLHRGEFGLTDTKAKKIIGNIFCPYTYELLSKKYIPIRIKSIKPCGVRQVYDLEINDDHNYIANDMIVHNCFAKKTGTQDHLPKIKAGFIATMKEKYGVAEEESEKLIVNFIQVINDASSYLFSKNHADPYSWIGYICGYLRYYYPLEFITTALNIFEDKEDKSLAIIDYAKKQGIRISPIKFRHSVANYNFDKQTNEIFKGISSIKYMNKVVADDMYALRDNHYPTFMHLLFDLSEKTRLNSRQLQILIELDFFSEFGDINYLLEQYRLFTKFNGKVQFRKANLAAMGFTEEKVRPFAISESEKIFKVDMRSMLLNIGNNVTYKPITLAERVMLQIEHLGYINLVGEQYSGMAVVLEVDTKYSPKVKMYSLKNGTTLDCKISKQVFGKCKLEKGELVKILGQNRKAKQRKNEDGEWVTIPGVFDIWITKYQKVSNL